MQAELEAGTKEESSTSIFAWAVIFGVMVGGFSGVTFGHITAYKERDKHWRSELFHKGLADYDRETGEWYLKSVPKCP